jgi:hypothetical protein
MRIRIAATAVGLLLAGPLGCAPRPRPTTAPAATALEARTPEINRGQPIAHAEMAADLAELSLGLQGIDCRGRESRVSFREGVYRVTFVDPRHPNAPRYRVELDAATSEVLRAERIEPEPAADR